jgi:hypothetical protein
MFAAMAAPKISMSAMEMKVFLVLHSPSTGMALVPERKGFACERKVGLRRAAGQPESRCNNLLCDAQNGSACCRCRFDESDIPIAMIMATGRGLVRICAEFYAALAS